MPHSPSASPDPVLRFVPEQEQFASAAPPLRDWRWLHGELSELAALSERAGLSVPRVQALHTLCERLDDNTAERLPLHALRSRLGEGAQRERAEQELTACIAAVQEISFAVGDGAADQQQELLQRCGLILLGIAATAGLIATAADSPLFLCGLMASCGLFGLSELEFPRADTSAGALEREDLRRVIEELKELGLAMSEEDFLATEGSESSEDSTVSG